MACCNASRKDTVWVPSKQPAAEIEEDKRITADLRSQQTQYLDTMRLIVLGLPGSGKSTFLSQLVQIYGPGFPEDQRKALPAPPVVQWMRTLCSQLEATLKLTLTPGSVAQAAELVCSLPGTTALDEKVGSAIATLWRDEIVRRAWEQRSQFSEAIPDGAAYFFDKVAEVSPWLGYQLRAFVRQS